MLVTIIFPLPFPKQALVFTCLQYKSFENIAGKGEIARNEQFLLFPQCFLYFQRTFYHFHQNQNCRLQTLSVWKSLKFVVWERVNPQSFLPYQPNQKSFTEIVPILKISSGYTLHFEQHSKM